MCEVTILMFVTVRPIKVRVPVLIQSITATIETNVQHQRIINLHSECISLLYFLTL